jgi:hypothetical protein
MNTNNYIYYPALKKEQFTGFFMKEILVSNLTTGRLAFFQPLNPLWGRPGRQYRKMEITLARPRTHTDRAYVWLALKTVASNRSNRATCFKGKAPTPSCSVNCSPCVPSRTTVARVQAGCLHVLQRTNACIVLLRVHCTCMDAGSSYLLCA